jgi:hypothetical protein
MIPMDFRLQAKSRGGRSPGIENNLCNLGEFRMLENGWSPQAGEHASKRPVVVVGQKRLLGIAVAQFEKGRTGGDRSRGGPQPRGG